MIDTGKLPAAFEADPIEPEGYDAGGDFDFENEFDEPASSVSGGSSPSGPNSGTSTQGRSPSGATPGTQGGTPPGTGSSFTQQHYDLGSRFGMSREQVEQFGDPMNLDRFIGHVLKQATATHGGQVQNPGQQGQAVPNQAPRQPDPSQQQASAFQRFDRKVFENPDLFDPEAQKALTSIVDHYESIIEKSVLPQVQQLQQQFQQQQFQQELEGFDSLIEGLGESWHEVFGKGRSYDFGATSEEGRARDKVFEEMDVLANAYAQTNRPVPPQRELFDRAVRHLFGDRYRQEARQAIGKQLRDSTGRFTARPTSSEGGHKAMSPEQRAAAFATSRYQAAGMTEEDLEGI